MDMAFPGVLLRDSDRGYAGVVDEAPEGSGRMMQCRPEVLWALSLPPPLNNGNRTDGIKLTHWGIETHICVGKLTNHHWFRQWLVSWPAQSHCLSQWWNIVSWILGNKPQWNLIQNSYIFIQENASESMAAKWWPFCPGGDELMA